MKTELLDISYSLAVRHISERLHQAANEEGRTIRTPAPDFISIRAQPSSGFLALAEGLTLLFDELDALREEVVSLHGIVAQLQSELGDLSIDEPPVEEPRLRKAK